MYQWLLSKHSSKSKYTNKRPWFSYETRQAKSQLGKAARIVSEFPNSDYLRHNYYQVQKAYKNLCKSKKENFLKNLNQEIEGGKILNWKQFKKLKDIKSDKIAFDAYDMENFETFFKIFTPTAFLLFLMIENQNCMWLW